MLVSLLSSLPWLTSSQTEIFLSSFDRFEPFPKAGATRNPDAYKEAIDSLPRGSAITIFTPDSTHFDIALYAIRRGIHVLVTKPAVQHLVDHLALVREAEKAGVYV